MAAKVVTPIQELHDIAEQQGFGPPTYKLFRADKNSFKCSLKFFTYTIEGTARTEDQSLYMCCTNMLIFWKCPDEFKSVCTKELNVTIHYDELNKAIEDKKRKNNKTQSKQENEKFLEKKSTPVSFLYEYAAKSCAESPDFTEVLSSDGKYSIVCKFMKKTVESEFKISKKTTKHDAALKMIRLIGLDIPSEVELSCPNMNQDHSNTNYIGALQNLAIKQNEAVPFYELDISIGPQHGQEFKMKCSYKKINKTGCGKTKQEAKSAAAALVLSQLQSDSTHLPISSKESSTS